jgi:plastocyanin
MTKRFATMLAAGVVALAAWASAAPAPRKLDIQHFKFLPPTVTIAPGTTVTWVNHDEETHTVMSATGSFASAALEHEQTFAHTFAAPGTYTYFCALHPLMRATVVVQ